MKTSLSRFTALVFTVLTFVPAFGAQWNATVGAQSEDKGRQVVAFLPNELWIDVGDSIQKPLKAYFSELSERSITVPDILK